MSDIGLKSVDSEIGPSEGRDTRPASRGASSLSRGNLNIDFWVASLMFSCLLFFSSTSKPRVVNTVNQTIAVLIQRIFSFFFISFLYNMLFFFFLLSIVFLLLRLRWGEGGCKGGGEGRCSGKSGAGGDCCSCWLKPEGGALLSPCDASVWVDAVARPTNVLNTEY